MLTRSLIAIDATAVPAQPAGAGRYTLSLVNALARVDHEHNYVVFARTHSLAELSDLGYAFEVVDIGPISRTRRYLWEQIDLPDELRKRRARLLHSPHHTTPLLYSPCPRVLTIHDVTFFLLPERYPMVRRLFFQVATYLALKRAKAVLVPSNSAADDLHTVLHPRPDRVHVTHEGVDPAFKPLDAAATLTTREHYHLPERYLLSLGTREPGKNRLTLFHALKRLVDSGRDLQLVVVGGGGWKAESAERDALKALGISDRVHYTGYVAQDDLPAIYNGADVFVFPSLHEGFGLPVVEAMACGTPVVTSDRSSLPEVVGHDALLVDPTDAAAIAHAIARVLDEPELRLLLRQGGLERAKRFTWDACAEQTLKVYRKVLGEA